MKNILNYTKKSVINGEYCDLKFSSREEKKLYQQEDALLSSQNSKSVDYTKFESYLVKKNRLNSDVSEFTSKKDEI